MRNFSAAIYLILIHLLWLPLTSSAQEVHINYKYTFTTDSIKPKENIIIKNKSTNDTSTICFSVKDINGNNLDHFLFTLMKRRSSFFRSEYLIQEGESFLLSDSNTCKIIPEGNYYVLPSRVGYGFKIFKVHVSNHQRLLIEVTARYIPNTFFSIESPKKISKKSMSLIRNCFKLNHNCDVKQYCAQCNVTITNY